MDGVDTRLRLVEQGMAGMPAKIDVLVASLVAKLPSWWADARRSSAPQWRRWQRYMLPCDDLQQHGMS